MGGFVTLYLKVAVGNASYLIAAAQIADVGLADAGAAQPAVSIDCRRLFGQPAETFGCRIELSLGAAKRLGLIVDRLEGLAELDEAVFRPLPPIGRHGALIDAVAMPVAAEPPALRLHLEAALLPAGARDQFKDTHATDR